MKAVLLTDLERAVIDRLRGEHPAMQHTVLLTLDLPMTREIMDFMEQSRNGSEVPPTPEHVIWQQRKQEKAVQRYRLEGYGQTVQIGEGKAVPHLRKIRPGQIGSGCGAGKGV